MEIINILLLLCIISIVVYVVTSNVEDSLKELIKKKKTEHFGWVQALAQVQAQVLAQARQVQEQASPTQVQRAQEQARPAQAIDLIDTSDNNPLIKELKKMKEGLDKLGNIVNVADNGYKSALKELENIANKVKDGIVDTAVKVKDGIVDAYEKTSKWLYNSCYRDTAQCYTNDNSVRPRYTFIGNTTGVPYACILGNNWVRNVGQDRKDNGEWKIAVDKWRSPYCERDFPNECSTGEKCFMNSR